MGSAAATTATLTMLTRVRVRSQTTETKLVENLQGLDILLAPRGYAACGQEARDHHVFALDPLVCTRGLGVRHCPGRF